LAIHGIASRPRRKGTRFVASAIEHASVLGPLERLASRGFELTLVGVSPHGRPDAGVIDLDCLADKLDDRVCMVSVMLASNEIGVVQPLAEVARLCRDRGIPLHCDATQAVGKIKVDVDELGVDLLSFSAHKLYGPKGVGVLYVRKPPRGVRLDWQIVGGGQQSGRRAGTLNVPGIVGLAKALELCQQQMLAEAERLASLRGDLARQLMESVPRVELCGPALGATSDTGQLLRLPHNLNVLVDGVDVQALAVRLPDLALSSGAACSSTSPEPSHVLRALNLSDDRIRGSLRIGLGRFNTAAALATAGSRIAAAVAELRTLAGE
jgi:cysteine desulfurase